MTLYLRRYAILAALFLLNLSNAAIWNTFASIAGKTTTYFSITFDDVNMLSVVFAIITIPVGFLAAWMIDEFDLRKSVIGASVMNAVGSILRVISSLPDLSKNAGFPILMTGQCISGFSQAFFLFLPPKCAQHWFPTNERAIANTIGTLGILLGGILSPVLLERTTMLNLMVVYSALSICALIVTLLSFTASKPPTAPSNSAEVKQRGFKDGFREAIRNPMFVTLTLCFGAAMGLFSTLVALIAQILCPFGYTDTYAGIVIVLMIGCGFLGAVCSALLVDRTKWFEEVLKIYSCITAMSACVLLMAFSIPDQRIGIGVIVSVLGFFGFGMYAIALELAVETTHPVPEATSTGIMCIFGQVCTVIFILIFQELGTSYFDYYGTCSTDAMSGSAVKHYLGGNIFMACIACSLAIVLVVFYKCPYKRLEIEKTLNVTCTENSATNLAFSGDNL